MLNRIAFLALLISFSAQAFREGFNGPSEATPSVVKQSWNATYLVRLENASTIETGSAFLFHVNRKEVVEELYFLTNEHVIAKHCPGTGTCDALRLIQHGLMDPQTGKMEETGEDSVNYGGVEIIKRSSNPDLAILKVTVLRSVRTPRPLKIASSCFGANTNRLYAIGYPGTNLRTAPGSQEIADKDWTFKRWSSGYSTGAAVKQTSVGRAVLEGTTIDALPGNSGGPVINSSGEVMGVMKGTDETAGFAYTGSESSGLKAYSYIESCSTMQNFLNLDELNGCF